MKGALGLLLLGALASHFGAHVAIVARLARARDWGRAAAAFLLPPLAPWWGWQAGMRGLVVAWAAGLAIYALGVALA